MSESLLYHKKIDDFVLMYFTGIWGPIILQNNSSEILKGIEAYRWLCNRKQLVRARLVLTGSCNLRCYHCYAYDDYNSFGVNTLDMKKIINEISKAGVFFLQLDGGEIGCRNDLSEIINYATQQGLIIEFFTNGTLFDDDFFKQTNFENIYCVVFSIHSHIEDLHDSLVGVKGSFKKAIKNLQIIKDYVKKVVLKMTITQKNYDSIRGLFELSKKLGVDFAYDIDILPHKNYSNENLQLNGSDLILLRNSFEDILNKRPTKRICIGGRSSCSIDQYGNVFPCRLIDIKLGNVLKESLQKIWNSKYTIRIVDEIFKEPANCNSCGDLSKYCFYCPGKAYINKLERDKWVEYNCYLAKRKRALFHE